METASSRIMRQSPFMYNDIVILCWIPLIISNKVCTLVLLRSMPKDTRQLNCASFEPRNSRFRFELRFTSVSCYTILDYVTLELSQILWTTIFKKPKRCKEICKSIATSLCITLFLYLLNLCKCICFSNIIIWQKPKQFEILLDIFGNVHICSSNKHSDGATTEGSSQIDSVWKSLW